MNELPAEKSEPAGMSFFRHAALWFFGVSVFLALAVFTVDPFVRYRKPAFFKPIYSSANSRQMIPGVLRHFEYDSVIVGNSQAQNISLAAVREELGWNAVKATSPACSPRVLGQFLELAFASRGTALTNVWLSLNVATYAGTLDFDNDVVAPYLYDATHWGDYKYLLNLDVITQRVLKSLYATFGGGGKSYALRTNPDNMFSLAASKSGYGEEVVKAAYRADLAAGARKRGMVNVMPRVADVEEHLLRHIRENRHATFYIVLTPMTSLVWHEFRKNRQLDQVTFFLNVILDNLRDDPNVEIIDAVSDPALVHDFSFYRDTVHYSPEMDAILMAMVKDGSRRVRTIWDVYALTDRLRELSRAESQPAWALNGAQAFLPVQDADTGKNACAPLQPAQSLEEVGE